MTEQAPRVLLDVADEVATITLNRPESLNALDSRTLSELGRAVRRCRADKAVRAVVLTGAGRAFCAGADVKEWAAGEQPGEGDDVSEDWVTMAHRLLAHLYRLPKPVVAAVNGVAVGAGLDLALSADFRVASEGARFGSVYIRIGIPPDVGASFLLPRIVGVTKAKELIYTGRIVDSGEALSCGLVSELVPAEAVLPRALELAGELAAGPTVAIGLAKENIQEHEYLTVEQALQSEHRAGEVAMATEDHKEGLAAVNARRQPSFKGR